MSLFAPLLREARAFRFWIVCTLALYDKPLTHRPHRRYRRFLYPYS
nr:MAG TPA: hypothetical protein [Caudoviricetes sp.]